MNKSLAIVLAIQGIFLIATLGLAAADIGLIRSIWRRIVRETYSGRPAVERGDDPAYFPYPYVIHSLSGLFAYAWFEVDRTRST